MPSFGLQRRGSKSPDRFPHPKESIDGPLSNLCDTARPRRSGSSTGRASRIFRSGSGRVALPEVRELVDHVDRRPRVEGNAFSGLKPGGSKALVSDEKKHEQKHPQSTQFQVREQSRTDKIKMAKIGRPNLVEDLVDFPFVECRDAQPTLKLASEAVRMVHPAFRSDAENQGSRLKNFVHNLMPRSPTKESFDMSILDEKLKSVKAEGRPRLSLITWIEKQSPATPSPRDDADGSSTSLTAENTSSGDSAIIETESLNPTPSKAAKLLGLASISSTPSKATRILGHGREGEDELSKRRVGARLSSGEHRNSSPSSRVARLIEGAAARLSKVRDPFDFSEVHDDMNDGKNSESGHEDETDINQTTKPPVFRTPSLKYMDGNTIPPTPPDKDTIYRLNRPKSELSIRPHVSTLFSNNTSGVQQGKKQVPIVRGESGSLKANLVRKPSIYSMSGVIEGRNTIRCVQETIETDDKVEDGCSTPDIFITPHSVQPKPTKMTVAAVKDTHDFDTNVSEYGSEKEMMDNASTIHPSAMPTPLYANRDSLEARLFAPPDDLLTHFDIVNTHVMRATNGLHDKIEAFHVELTREMRRKHSESIALLNERFKEVYERIHGIEHDVGRVVGTVTDTQESLASKLDALASTIQIDFVRRLDHLLFAHSEMTRKVDNISLHLQDVQVKQQYMMDSMKGRMSVWQSPANGSIDETHPPLRTINQHIPINHSMQLTTPCSPSPIFNDANIPVEPFMSPIQLTNLTRAYSDSGQPSIHHTSQTPASALLGSVYGGMRPNSSGSTRTIPIMVSSDSIVPLDNFLAQAHGMDTSPLNGHVKRSGNGEGQHN